MSSYDKPKFEAPPVIRAVKPLPNTNTRTPTPSPYNSRSPSSGAVTSTRSGDGPDATGGG